MSIVVIAVRYRDANDSPCGAGAFPGDVHRTRTPSRLATPGEAHVRYLLRRGWTLADQSPDPDAAVAVKLDSPAGLLPQSRVGRNGREFRL